MTADRLPVLFLSHGAPPLADDRTWTSELRAWGASLPRPESILVVSAHWEEAPTTVSATVPGVPLVYDFWGFPERYYRVRYDAPAAPALADAAESLLVGARESLHRAPSRGLDHGAYVPLREMFPDADIPVLQLSMPTLDPARLFDLGRTLAPLRDEGTLIVASGFTTHNLRWFDPSGAADAPAPAASREFDHWAAQSVEHGDIDGLIDFAHRAPAASIAHPRTEHWVPLHLALGAADASGGIRPATRVEGFWYGLSKRSWQFD